MFENIRRAIRSKGIHTIDVLLLDLCDIGHAQEFFWGIGTEQVHCRRIVSHP
tara:strand:+ start:233 stop:388 length:156 start_codon:yes stop_codon:yes gene_type:complete